MLERPDGMRVAFMPYPTPLRDETGAIVAGSNILLKIEKASRRPSFRGAVAGRPPVRTARFAGMHGCSA